MQFIFHLSRECFTMPLMSCICSVAGGQSDQGYDSLSKEEVRMGAREEQDSSPHMKEKKERDSIPCELCFLLFFSSAGVSCKTPPSGVVWCCKLLYNHKMLALSCWRSKLVYHTEVQIRAVFLEACLLGVCFICVHISWLLFVHIFSGQDKYICKKGLICCTETTISFRCKRQCSCAQTSQLIGHLWKKYCETWYSRADFW